MSLTEDYDSLPIKLDCFVWHALVGACNFHGVTEIGKLAAEKLSHLAPDSSVTYILKEGPRRIRSMKEMGGWQKKQPQVGLKSIRFLSQ